MIEDESSTKLAFKKDLVSRLPFFPNTKSVKTELLDKSLVEVLFHYIHWASRIIPARPRSVIREQYLLLDQRYDTYKSDVNKLLRKVELGEDLISYHSNLVRTKGYSPKDKIRDKNDAWIDKDELLNTRDFYHLHLKPNGRGESDVILFAMVNRNTFRAIGLFDHSVFDKSGRVTSERERMLSVFYHIIQRELPSGSSLMTKPITMSGHPIHLHQLAWKYSSVIDEFDDKLSDREYVAALFKEGDLECPKKPKLKWMIFGLDLGFYELKSKVFFCLVEGYL